MEVDILDIKHVIQWKIIDHSTFTTIFYQIKYVMQKIEIQAVAVVFVESKRILPKNMINAVDKYFFTCLPIAKGEKNVMKKVISSIYKDNIQIRKEGDFSAFYKVNLPLLQFLNMVDGHKYLVLTCFVNNFAFESHAPDISCYDNCLYSSYKGANRGDDFGIPDWELQDVTMRYSLCYLEINEQHRHQEHITIAKEIDIRTTRFELKENKKIYR